MSCSPLLGLHRQALPREAGGARLRAQLQLGAVDLAGLWAQASGAQARRAPAQAPAPCAPRHDGAPDGSRHEWLPGQPALDLIVTMDDATSEIVDEEGTMSSFRALSSGSCSLYADRASHYWHTPEAGGKVDKGGGARASAPRIELTGLARSQGAVLGTFRSACPNSGSPASPRSMRPTASSRRSICPNTTPASRSRPRSKARPSSPSQARSTISSASKRSAPSRTRASAGLQLPADRHRRHYVATVRVHEYRRHPRAPMPSTPQPGRPRGFDATGQRL